MVKARARTTWCALGHQEVCQPAAGGAAAAQQKGGEDQRLFLVVLVAPAPGPGEVSVERPEEHQGESPQRQMAPWQRAERGQ